MKKIVFINGTIGVGKTTLGTFIQEQMDNCIFIDADMFCFWGKNNFFSQLESVILDNLTYSINNYLSSDFIDTVIVAWVFDQEKIDKIQKKISFPFISYCFTLLASDQTIYNHLLQKKYNNDRLAFLLSESKKFAEKSTLSGEITISVDGLPIKDLYEVVRTQLDITD